VANIVQKPQGTSPPPEADFTFCEAKVKPLRLAVLALGRCTPFEKTYC